MVFRVYKNENYSVMSNYHLKDKNLSLKAKGLLSVMLSLPDDWCYSISGLTKMLKESKDTISNIIIELEKFGYVKRTLCKNEKGQFSGYDYDVFEYPNQDEPQGKKPFPENQDTGNPDTDNQAQLNTNIVNNTIKQNINNNSLETYKENDNDNEVSYNDSYNDSFQTQKSDVEIMFNEFWEEYPRHDAKKVAFKKFSNIKNLKVEFPKIIEMVRYFKTTPQWNKDNGQYIPMPATFINQERWNDEKNTTNTNKKPSILDLDIDTLKDQYNYVEEDRGDKLPWEC